MRRSNVLNLVVLSLAIAFPAGAQFGNAGSFSTRAEAERAAREHIARAEQEAREAKQRLDEATLVVDREEQAMGRQYDPMYREKRIRQLAAAPRSGRGAGMAPELAISPDALGDSTADLVYTPLPPCRIIDTRVAGGMMAAGSMRSFVVAGTTGFEAQGGTAGGCGVPVGPASAAHINFVAVAPAGSGNLRAWAFGAPEPTSTSIINYQLLSPNLNVANAINVPLAQHVSPDLSIRASINAVHVVADVLGYYSRVPKEQVLSSLIYSSVAGGSVSTTCTEYFSVPIFAEVAGTVEVRAFYVPTISHTTGTTSQVQIHVSDASAVCSGGGLGISGAFAYVGAGMPTEYYFPELTATSVFDVSPGVHTFYLNHMVTSGDNINEQVGQMVLTFRPN